MAFEIAEAVVAVKTQLDQGSLSKTQGQVESGMGKFADKMGSVGGSLTKGVTLPVLAAGTAIGGMAINAASNADAVVKSARAAGISTDAYQELEYALGQAGMSQDTMDKVLKRNNQRLGEAADGTGKYAEAYKALGVETHDANGNLRSSEDVMNDVISSIASIEDPALRSSMAADLLGKNAGADLAVALDGGADAIDGARARAHELGIVMGDDALAGSEAFMDGLDDLKRSFGGMVVEIGNAVMPMLQALLPIIVDTLVPAFQRFADFVGGLVQKFTELSPRAQSIIVGLLGLATAIGPMLVMGAKLIKGFQLIMQVWKLLNLAFLMNPWVLLIAAVVALVVVIVKNWDTIKEYLAAAWEWIKATAEAVWTAIKDFFVNTWNAIKEFAVAIWDGIKAYFKAVLEGYKLLFTAIWEGIKKVVTGIWNGLKAAAKAIFDGIKAYFTEVFNFYKTLITTIWNGIKTFLSTIWNGIKAVATTVFNAIKSYFTNVFNFYKTLITNVWNAIKDTISRVLDTIKTTVSNIWNNIKDTISRLINAAKTAVTNAVGAIRDAVSNGFNAAKELATTAFNKLKTAVTDRISEVLTRVRELPGKIKSGLGNLGNLLYSAGKDLIRGLMNGIMDMAGGVARKAREVVRGAIDAAKRALGIGSPSKVFHQFGEWTGEGLAIGMEDQRKNVRKSAQKMMDFGPVPTLEAGVAMAGGGAGSGRGGNVNNNYRINVTIPAKDLKEMRDVQDFFGHIRQATRQGAGV